MTNTHVTTVTKVIARIKPCRYFQYGSGRCSPRSGECRYDHTVVPDNERELCFHKEACTFKNIEFISTWKAKRIVHGEKYEEVLKSVILQ